MLSAMGASPYFSLFYESMSDVMLLADEYCSIQMILLRGIYYTVTFLQFIVCPSEHF